MRQALTVLVLVLTLARTAPAAEDKRKTKAIEHFRIGYELVQQRAWDSALVEFLRSRELFPTITALLNAAVCLRELSRYDEALDMYDELMARFGTDLKPEERAAVEADVARIAQHVGTLVVRSQPAGASVNVDGRILGATPLSRPARLAAGLHALYVVSPGFAPYERTIAVTGGREQQVLANLTPVAAVGAVRVSEAAGKVFEVLVDGGVVGTTPWEGTLGSGKHTFALRGQGDMGTEPTTAKVATARITEVVLKARALPGEIHVEPTPADALVLIDGRPVSRGAWTGSLTSGDHVLELRGRWSDPVRLPVIVSSRAPLAVRPALERARRLYVELFGGVALFANTRARGITGCPEGSCLGNPGGVRLGFRVAPRVAIDAFFLGMGLLRESTQTVTVVSSGVPTTVTDYQQHVNVGVAVAGVGTSYQFFDRTPLTLRLAAGLGSISAGADGTERTEVLRYFLSAVIYPEVRFGYRLTRAITLDLGLGAVLFMMRDIRPRDPQLDPYGGIFPEPTFAHGLAYCFPVTAAVQVSF